MIVLFVIYLVGLVLYQVLLYWAIRRFLRVSDGVFAALLGLAVEERNRQPQETQLGD